MTTKHMVENRDTVLWVAEPDGATVLVSVTYGGRPTLIEVDTVQVTRATWTTDGRSRGKTLDVIFTTAKTERSRPGRWAWHAADEPQPRQIFAEGTDAEVVALLTEHAPEALTIKEAGR